MKKFLIIFLLISSFAAYTAAQEMQFSFGADAGFGVYKIENIIQASILPFTENAKMTYFAPGISFFVRVFPESDSFITQGFVFRDRALLVINGEVNGSMYSINQGKFSIGDEKVIITIMDFGAGFSNKIKLLKGLFIYTDAGVNLTIMDIESTMYMGFKSELNYLGAGIFADLALQLNITNKLYLEFGINTVINVFSSQKGEYSSSFVVKNLYEDTGRWDMSSVSAYLHFGWRFNLNKLKRN